MSRNVYLDRVAVPVALEAAKKVLDRDALVAGETVDVHRALGRVTSRAVHARYSSPTFHSAAMDGIAVKASTTFAAREGDPVRLKSGEDYESVNTGNLLPAFADAVVMIENVAFEGDEALVETPAFPWQHVRRIGEDIVATELLVPRSRRLSAYDLGALLSGGIFDVEVHERIRMRIIPTGDEVLDFTERPDPAPGQVVESNSTVMCALAEERGYLAERVAPVGDDEEKLAAAVKQALESDAHMVIIGAGSSAGSKDFTRAVMERFGRVLVHGLTAMPGKPTVIGVSNSGKPMIGAPGYPVSTVVCFEQIVLPLADWLSRRVPRVRVRVPVHLTRKVPSKLGTEEFLRVAVGRVGGRNVATPLGRGAGMITTLTNAQGVVRIPEHFEGLDADAVPEAELLVDEAELSRTLVAVGSHDNTLDLLADMLMGLEEPVRLASTHVGSMGAISALKAGNALCGGCHLFDPQSEDFNFPFLEKYAPDMKVRVVNLAVRHQGLIVAKGNPKGISGIDDLARDDVAFINRQRGAGTRILLDHHLDKARILPDAVRGYDREEFTHMAVAVNVLTGAADCGLGIHAAARALDLDFVPLALERYDLLIPEEHMADARIAALLEIVGCEEFKRKVREMGGYETGLTGREMRPGQGLG